MAFEDAIAVLGRDIGMDLVAEDGTAGFVAMSSDGGERIDVSISAMEDGMSVMLCADLGDMPEKNAEKLMLRMLEANHMFEATGGATLSVEDGRAKLERYVGIVALQRGDGAKLVLPFVETARKWCRLIAAGGEGMEDGDRPLDGSVLWPPTA